MLIIINFDQWGKHFLTVLSARTDSRPARPSDSVKVIKRLPVRRFRPRLQSAKRQTRNPLQTSTCYGGSSAPFVKRLSVAHIRTRCCWFFFEQKTQQQHLIRNGNTFQYSFTGLREVQRLRGKVSVLRSAAR